MGVYCLSEANPRKIGGAHYLSDTLFTGFLQVTATLLHKFTDIYSFSQLSFAANVYIIPHVAKMMNGYQFQQNNYNLSFFHDKTNDMCLQRLQQYNVEIPYIYHHHHSL